MNSVNNWLTSVLCFCESRYMIFIGMINRVLLRNADAGFAHIYINVVLLKRKVITNH